MSLSASTCIDVEDQFPMFSDGTPPLFRKAPHVVDQSDQIILVNSDPLFFHTVFETGRTEVLGQLDVVNSSLPFSSQTVNFIPVSCVSLNCPTPAARCESTTSFSGSMKQYECTFHISFTAGKPGLLPDHLASLES